MGVDLEHRRFNKSRKEPKSCNPELLQLFKVYSYLARRTGNEFDGKVAHRLCLSNTNRRPFSVSRLATALNGKAEETIAVVVSTITNDERLLEIPAMKVCALKFTETARARILAAGGQCLTFDQLATLRPTGENCLLLEGDRNKRFVAKHFGANPGDNGSLTRPKVRAYGRKFEMARGRRNSRWYKA